MFSAFTRRVAYYAGRPGAFLAGLGIVLAWLASGPFFGWSDTHSLMINTFTTCITFLLLFVLQNTQNRDTDAIKLMLEEMIRDLKEVDETQARRRIESHEKPTT